MAWPAASMPILFAAGTAAGVGAQVHAAGKQSKLAKNARRDQQEQFALAQEAQQKQLAAEEARAAEAAAAQSAFLESQSALLAESQNENRAAARRAVEQDNLLTRREASRIKARRRAGFQGRRLLLSGSERGATTLGA